MLRLQLSEQPDIYMGASGATFAEAVRDAAVQVVFLTYHPVPVSIWPWLQHLVLRYHWYPEGTRLYRHGQNVFTTKVLWALLMSGTDEDSELQNSILTCCSSSPYSWCYKALETKVQG